MRLRQRLRHRDLDCPGVCCPCGTAGKTRGARAQLLPAFLSRMRGGDPHAPARTPRSVRSPAVRNPCLDSWLALRTRPYRSAIFACASRPSKRIQGLPSKGTNTGEGEEDGGEEPRRHSLLKSLYQGLRTSCWTCMSTEGHGSHLRRSTFIHWPALPIMAAIEL